MGSRLFILTLILCFFHTHVAFSQIAIVQVAPGPYTPESTIAATFSLGSTCLRPGNLFNLYLVSANGAETPIGSYKGFYSTFVNGVIPQGTSSGTGYRLRVKSTLPVVVSSDSGPFEIKAGEKTIAALSSGSTVSTDPLTFGTCSTNENIETKEFFFDNKSSTGNVTVTFKNELKIEAPQTIAFSAIGETKPYTASLTHYTVFVKATKPDGSIGTIAYFLINNLAVTAFTTTSGNTVCLPAGTFEYRVDASNAGIGVNFPGNIYKIDWGDGTSNDYTYCDIRQNNDRVNHVYNKSSCGLSYRSGNQTFYNAFGVNVGLVSPFCGAIGSPLSTPARVVAKPVNLFSFSPIGCVNDDVIFENKSSPGEQTNTNSMGCALNNVTYNWYVDGVLVALAKPLTYSLVHKFLVKGKYKIRLSSRSDGACQADDIEQEICIQERPKPSFTLPANQICLASGTLTPVNTSVLDNTSCPSTPVYTWDVTPAEGVSYNKSSITPQFMFTQTGVYNITLTVKTGTCQEITLPQKVVVNEVPRATLSPDVLFCQKGDFVFDPDAIDTKTVISGTAETLSDTYKWEVIGAGGYSFVGSTTANSEYPTINFADFGSYTVRLTHQNNCGTITRTQKITLIAQPPILGNIIGADQVICSGGVPTSITGPIPTGGDGSNYTYSWEQSTDNGVNWTVIAGEIKQIYNPASLPGSTQYRRLVSSGSCSGSQANISNSITITVKADAIASFTFTSDKGCTPFNIDNQNVKAIVDADRNDIYIWYANNVEIGRGDQFPGYQIINDNESVVIKLVVTSKQGCRDAEMSHTFSTRENIKALFTQDKSEGCGPLQVNFTNTSTSFVDADFKWDFGNGTTSALVTPPPITFLAHPEGKDTTYVTTLHVTSPCGTDVFTSSVFVKAQPIAVFSPDKTVGCSPMKVIFSNTSPGGTNTYYYDFGDGTILTKTDKLPVEHVYVTGTIENYTVRMRAVNDCGSHESSYNIQVSVNTILPELVVNSSEKSGCAPFIVNFHNNSKGANLFKYDFGDGGSKITRSAPETVQYTFKNPGVYNVVLTASNGCSDTTTTETITVLEQPIINFSADKTTGCPGIEVKFNNLTTGALSYLWDFGDGKTSTEFEPTHTYSGSNPFYTVTLTATNSLNCPNTLVQNDFIKIITPPIAQFSVDPGLEINIPLYTFNFIDESTNNPAQWLWDFGDGATSTDKNPKHTYPDTGLYKVTLKVINQSGCFTSSIKEVRITGVPGYLFVPNSFIPNGENAELRQFKAKGSGIKSWRMSVFNKWGELLWETTKLDEGHPQEGWDGTYHNTELPQSVYYWEINVEFINGFQWKGMSYDKSSPKRTGPIHLIR